MATPTAAQLAAEIQQQVTAFYAGDEKYAGAWLTDFQRHDGAWEVCMQALQPGPLPSCDEELLQEFCAQTLGRLARSFGTRHAPAARRTQRDALAVLLQAHAAALSRRVTWKHLALALTCADLTLGAWAPPARSGFDGELPAPVRRELLSLPVDLLFCDRALPLGDGVLQQAAGSLLDACGRVFEELLLDEGNSHGCLGTLAAWLGALRKALRLLPTRSEAAPLEELVKHGGRLEALVRARPGEAAEVALQLSRWHQVDCRGVHEQLLGPMLGCILEAVDPKDCAALLPLISELATGCWPRAALGEFALDWRMTAASALAVLGVTVKVCMRDDGQYSDAEAAFAVWQSFAAALKDGGAAPGGGAALGLADAPGAAGDARPEKRSRVRGGGAWRPDPEHVAQCEALPQLFQMLVRAAAELLQLPDDTLDLEAMRAFLDLREAAELAIAEWADLPGLAQVRCEAACMPLQNSCARLAAAPEGCAEPEACRAAEAALWLSAAVVRPRPLEAAAAPPAAAVLELKEALDAAPEPWRTWLLASATAVAATAPPALGQQLVEWMLQRPPWATFAPELLEFTELPFAEALEGLCRQLPAGTAHVALGERLAALAFADRPDGAAHDNTIRAQGLMLQAMRCAMGEQAQLLCDGLARGVLPALCKAVDEEARSSPGAPDAEWRSARLLFATLAAALPPAGSPSADVGHPTVALWRQCWFYVEGAMLRWPSSSATDEPAASAAQALISAAQSLPGLLPEVVPLLARSAAQHELPTVQLDALRSVANGVRCPPVDAARAAELLGGAVGDAAQALLTHHVSLLESPPTLAAAFALLADAVRPSPAGMAGDGPCNDQLRPRMLANKVLMTRCLALVPLALPSCTSAPAAIAMLQFMANLVSACEQPEQQAAQRALFQAVLPELCASVCQALAAHENLADPDGGLAAAADFLLRAAGTLPDDLPGALLAGVRQAQLPACSGDRLRGHVSNRSAYAKLGDWLEDLQQIVSELQRESRAVSH